MLLPVFAKPKPQTAVKHLLLHYILSGVYFRCGEGFSMP